VPKVQVEAGAGPGRLARGRRVSATLSEINVVPLVDVMLVLLVIFMIAAPMIQRGIDVKLPVATRSAQISGERTYVTVPADYRENRRVFLGNESLPVGVLRERIRQRMEAVPDKQVYLQGDRQVQIQELIEVLDLLRAAGVENVGIVTELPERR
jgi:biopolymer transport protein ExbD